MLNNKNILITGYVLKINFKKLGKTRADLMKEFKSVEIITQAHYILVISHPYF